MSLTLSGSVSSSIKWENSCPTAIGLMEGCVSCDHHPVAGPSVTLSTASFSLRFSERGVTGLLILGLPCLHRTMQYTFAQDFPPMLTTRTTPVFQAWSGLIQAASCPAQHVARFLQSL